jgi:hypothetical protein
VSISRNRSASQFTPVVDDLSATGAPRGGFSAVPMVPLAPPMTPIVASAQVTPLAGDRG